MPARSKRRVALNEFRLAWETGALVVLLGVVAVTALAHIVVPLHERESWLLVGGAVATSLAIVGTFFVTRRIVVAGRAATQRLQQILDHAPYAISVVRLSDGRYLRVNKAFCQETGMTPAEALERSYHDILAPDRRDAAGAAREAVLQHGEVRDVEITTLHEGGRRRHILLSAVLLDEGPDPSAVLITINVTARREAEEARRAIAARYRRLYESLQDGFATTDLEGNIVETNPAFQDMLGYTAAELRGRNFRDLTVETWLAGETAQLEQVRTRGFSEVYEKEYRRKDGSILPVQLRTYLETDDRGGAVGYWAIVTDVSGRFEAERAVRASLAEKTILLQEVHHRVKNNLQIISSLLSLQADRSRSAAAAATLQDMRGRVHSMALLHEAIYRSPSLAAVDLPTYLESITSHLLRAHGSRAQAVRLALELQPLTLAIDPAVSCGLIVNELVSNALKHAFPGGRPGAITVRLAQDAGRLVLEVEDDGVGLPADFDPAATSTLGMQLVAMLAEKLDGTLDVPRGVATVFRVAFPAPRA